MSRDLLVILCGAALLIAAAVVVALLERQQAPLPEVPVAQTPADVRVKAVGRMGEALDLSNVETAKFSNRKPRRSSTEFGILSPETA